MPKSNQHAPQSPAGDSQISRRTFVAGSAAAFALGSSLGAKPFRQQQTRALFFNLSHLSNEGLTRHLVMGGRSYTMQPVSSGHPVLTQALTSNSFLRGLPASAITHMVEAIALPTDAVTTGYSLTVTSGGEWEMPSFYMNIPAQGFQAAYSSIAAGLEAGQPLPLSAKRMKYGLPPAANLNELLDEQIMFDSTNMAAAIVNLHPELLSVVPSSAALIHTSFTSPRSVFALSQYLENAGAAQPEQTTGLGNSTGWATLVPYTDENGDPLINQTGQHKGLILYDPQWSAATKTLASAAMVTALRGAKNYTPSAQSSGSAINLGVDATQGRGNIPDSQLTGTIWCRSDGTTSVDQSPGTPNALLTSSDVHYVLKNDSLNQNGYSVGLSSDASTKITLDFTNTYLRYLGVWAQFYDANGNLVPFSKLPSGIGDGLLSTDSSAYLGFIAPEFTIYGVPLQTSSLTVNFQFPTGVAASAAILASGLGVGSHTFSDTEPIGITLTSLFNLIIPPLLMAVGVAAQLDLFAKAFVIPFLQTSIAAFLGTEANIINFTAASLAKALWRALVKSETGPGLGLLVTKVLIPFLATFELVDSAEDAIPLAGAILQAIGVLGTIAEIDETTAEVLSSPWTYQYTLIGTHDLDVVILPDTTHKQFPSAAAQCTLTAIFDGGTPNIQQFAVSSPGASISAKFSAVPLGGQVTLHVALYSRDGTLVGHGSAGPLTNDTSASPSITITEDLLPITNGTQYFHKQKTSLDSQGNHLWVCGAAPAQISPTGFCENSPGNLCGFRNITVSSASNNIGYSWQSYSPASCSTGGSGQLDQMANIPSIDGSGNVQSGYAALPCALNPGTQLVYDPSARASSNFYLDTSNNVLRQVQLNPPSFAQPGQNQAWGKLNLSSTDLLLHPAGTVISINSASHKLESLKIPAAPMTDAAAGEQLLATVHSGLGSRPGLLDTPATATVTADGVVLVLEAGNNRIHALDIHGNPVRFFKNQLSQYFLNFSQTGGTGTAYLDIAAEFTGFIYVLSSFTSDQANYQYRLDIYASDQRGTNPICTTMGFNAAKVAVDYWRNVYSLNYEVLKLPNGNFPANGVTEPSISQWIPTAPPPCELGGLPPGRKDPMPRLPWPHRQTSSGAHDGKRLLRRRDFWRPSER